MDKIKNFWRDLSLRKSIILYISVFVILAIALSTITSVLCYRAEQEINGSYPPAGEKYYLTNENGERLGEGTYISKQKTPLSEKDERLLSVLEIVPIVATPIYSALCIIAASLLFYRNKLKEPLIKLRVASENIANNDLGFRVDYHSKDELGQLCVSFEIMRSTLESNFSEMWRQMEERKQLNAAFAHDLRTPLTVLKGYDEMLQSSSDSITRDIAETMGKHIFRLERYVDSMSQLHRLEDARPQGDNSDIKNFVITLADSATIFCEKNGKKICVQNNITDLPICLDGSFVSQVNNNLISNAVRYAKSAIKITYTNSKEGFYLTVSDDGCGFSKDVLCKATNPYFTGENHREHFGLGLYICKILCEHHGGYLKIENCSTGANATAFFKSLGL